MPELPPERPELPELLESPELAERLELLLPCEPVRLRELSRPSSPICSSRFRFELDDPLDPRLLDPDIPPGLPDEPDPLMPLELLDEPEPLIPPECPEFPESPKLLSDGEFPGRELPELELLPEREPLPELPEPLMPDSLELSLDPDDLDDEPLWLPLFLFRSFAINSSRPLRACCNSTMRSKASAVIMIWQTPRQSL